MVEEYEAAAAAARAAMVDRLRAHGVSERTLAAFADVPRQRLVPRFWSLPTTIAGRTTVAVEHRAGDVGSLGLLHDTERALAVNRIPGAVAVTTSTASAPRLLAAQADLLALEPGMSVLEIGTGPGYFAAILSELVGADGRVFTIDIDGEVAALAAERLDALGYANVTVLARDGNGGAPEHAPFDRIVGSVGCNDVAATWLRQCSPAGFGLVPLRHGCFHPMVRVRPDGDAAPVMRSGYVAIQGAQADASLWPHAGAAVAATARSPLPYDLTAALTAPPERADLGGLAEWDLAFWVAVHDQRAGAMVELNDGVGSSARIDARGGAIVSGGPSGRTLERALLAHARAWLTGGRPSMEDSRHRFLPIGTAPPGEDIVISRVDHDQVIARTW